MIAYVAQIWCNGIPNGCSSLPFMGVVNDRLDMLPESAQIAAKFAKDLGWTIDGGAHWCPKCTRQRTETKQ
jgi:hypothetical protein